jgi:hypothetical protein
VFWKPVEALAKADRRFMRALTGVWISEPEDIAMMTLNTLMRWLPLSFAIAHALSAIAMFGMALHSPERGGLAPVAVYYLDFPCSLIFEPLRRALHGDLGVSSRLIVDGSVYVVLGSLWFYAIGLMLRRIFTSLT